MSNEPKTTSDPTGGDPSAAMRASAEETQKGLDEQAKKDEAAAQEQGGHAPGYEFTEEGKKEMEAARIKRLKETASPDARTSAKTERRESREDRPKPTQLPADTKPASASSEAKPK